MLKDKRAQELKVFKEINSLYNKKIEHRRDPLGAYLNTNERSKYIFLEGFYKANLKRAIEKMEVDKDE